MYEQYQSPVRCSKGHVYTTTWVPFISLKAARLGPNKRFQHCPVGHHWALVTKLDPSTLTADERAAAAANHDSGIV